MQHNKVHQLDKLDELYVQDAYDKFKTMLIHFDIHKASELSLV